MRKILVFAVAVLASISMWAVEPSVSFEIPASGAVIGDYFKAWTVGSSELTISGTMDLTTKDSQQNISIDANASALDANYISFKVTSADMTIDSIVLLAGGSGNGKNVNAPVIGWENGYAEDGQTAVSLNFLNYTTPASGGGKIAGAEWRTIDLSSKEIKEARIYKKLSKNKVTIEGEDTSVDLGSGETVRIWGVKVWLKSGKTIVSQSESLFNAKVNGEDMLIDDFADLLTSQDLQMDAEYVTAPVVTFVKQISTTYDDQSSDVTYKDIDVTAEADPVFPFWVASTTINNIVYRVRMHIAASYTVTYMYGEEVLGTETVAVGAHPAEYEQYESMTLYTFGGWYKDAALQQAVADMADESINADATYYAKFTMTYLTGSVNIEQLVLDYGKKYDIESALTNAGWVYANLNELDSLNDAKGETRNEPYLGLKLKTAGAYVQCRLKVGDDRLYIKFGNVGCDVKIALKGATVNLEETFTKDQLAAVDNIIGVFGQPEDVVVTITTTAASTVVLKQLMLGDIEEVVLPVQTAIDNTLAAPKAIKRVVNGQVIIEKNGKFYDLLGTEIK